MGERVAGGAVRACERGHGGGDLGYGGGCGGCVVYDCVDCGDGFYVCVVVFFFFFSCFFSDLVLRGWGEERCVDERCF